MRKLSPSGLGATLYMPALRRDIHDVALGLALPGLRSVVICLEDSVADVNVLSGIANLRTNLEALKDRRDDSGPMLFVRPRHVEMARFLAEMPEMAVIDGFVAPKFRPGEAAQWHQAVAGTDLVLMPTLETPEVFDSYAMRELRAEMKQELGARVLALRIGGNDLLACLGVRRQRGTTLYDGPLGPLVAMLVGLMVPHGFHLTGPVYEVFDDLATLADEVARDVAHGLVGKTVIHPSQIRTVNAAFKVVPGDYEAAERILAVDAAAVFQHGGAMCEPTTHRAWALRIVERAATFGLHDSPAADEDLGAAVVSIATPLMA